ncbi:hypothetical protein [Bosea sp. RAC05]|jgi:hypothetical protein|uniref:hypothetical protein n=1 Tax=Bosea sp. RAC05 TaxID=1842539 RepID=UPI00083DEE9A|nr:hypothetical protein [Bosea sp. RAC05]AOG05828.1 hypothetical protein BSY19_1224 [Bosea sp. RAC05]
MTALVIDPRATTHKFRVISVTLKVVLAVAWLGLLGLAGARAAEPALPLDPPRQAQAPEPLCFCWNEGRKVAEGSSSCIRTTQGRRIAQCGRVTNVMSWQITGAPCPES